MIGRPSQPDLDNTSVGKPGEIGSCEEFSRVPGLWEGGFLLHERRCQLRALHTDQP